MSSSADTICKEIAKKKAAFKAEMAELVRKEEEAAEKEEEVARKAEAAQLAAEKAAKKEVKKGKKRAVEESRNLGELAEGIFWGWNPIADSEDYEEWLEQEWLEEDLEKESKELESEKAEC